MSRWQRRVVLRPSISPSDPMKSVAILVFPGVQSLDVSGPLDVFAEANRFLLPARQYRM